MVGSFNSFFVTKVKVLIGYIRVSKSDGPQLLDLQHDALLQARAQPDYIDWRYFLRRKK